jgi:hypothetical protein
LPICSNESSATTDSVGDDGKKQYHYKAENPGVKQLVTKRIAIAVFCFLTEESNK